MGSAKQDEIYSRVSDDLKMNNRCGAKLPSEREYAKILGVSRKLLRTALDRLAEENRIVRTPSGTFLKNEMVPGGNDTVEPITVLVPCPDYQTVSNYSSNFMIRQSIRGALDSAVRHGSFVVTLPVSDTNDKDEINRQQFRHLGKKSMVIFAGSWYNNFIPLLAEIGCRVGFSDSIGETTRELVSRHLKSAMICDLGSYCGNTLKTAVSLLRKDGAKRVAYLGHYKNFLMKKPSVDGKDDFMKELAGVNHENPGKFTRIYDERIPLQETLAIIREYYEDVRFDALIFESNFFIPAYRPFDFFESAGIPRSTRLVTDVSELLRLSLPSETRVFSKPFREIFRDTGDFLFSDLNGLLIRKIEYDFSKVGEFLDRTQFLAQKQ